MKRYMERKYYLRGLGIGIAVTAVIMGITVSGGQTMTDEEIIARAKELGMVEDTLLSDTLTQEDTAAENTEDSVKNSIEANAADTETAPAAEAAAEDAAQTAEDTAIEAQEQEDASAQTQEEEAQDETAEDGLEQADSSEEITTAAIKTITVTSGDGSYTVAKKLADVGVVTSAENFDTYLCENGYDKRLRTGTFYIPADASDEQIARIVTGAE